MSYRMLIVDDEQFVINGLKKAIDWGKYNIEIVGEAGNGRDALAFIRSHDVDILFTDIKMPNMDGIQLIEEIRTLEKNVKIVVLSGYEDFDYARTAIYYKVAEYLLKPATIEKITDVVERIVQQCNEECEREQHDLELELKLKEALPLMEERFYLRLLHGIYEGDLHSFLGIDLDGKKYRVVIVHIDDLFTDVLKDLSHKEQQLLILRIKELISFDLKDRYDPVLIPYVGNSIVLLLKSSENLGMDGLVRKFEFLQKKIRRRERVTVSFSYGNSCETLTGIQQSYYEAMEAIKYKFYYGNSSIISYEDVVNNQRSYVDFLSGWKQELVDSINLQDPVKSEELLLRIHKTLQSDNRYTIEYIRNLSMEIILILSLALYDKNEELEKIYRKKSNLLDYIQHLETLDSIFAALTDIFNRVISYLNEKRDSKNRSTINLVVRYIYEHLDQEITLEKIAMEVYLTPNYIGHIFKEKTGLNFNEYVTRTRMEHAKTLLKSPEYRVCDVSSMVGYKNPHYFTKLFKKYIGVTPSSYKDR